MRRSIQAAALAVTLAISGCATPYRHYEGPELPPEKVVALVSSQASATRELLSGKLDIPTFGTAKVLVNQIDGKSKPGKFSYNEYTTGQFEIHLLPGKHSLLLGIDVYWAVGSPIAIDFVAEPGHRYFLGGRVEGNRWHPVLVDETTNTLILPPR
jgi:hypothetical protein